MLVMLEMLLVFWGGLDDSLSAGIINNKALLLTHVLLLHTLKNSVKQKNNSTLFELVSNFHFAADSKFETSSELKREHAGES